MSQWVEKGNGPEALALRLSLADGQECPPSLGRFRAKLGIVGESRGSVEEISGENVDFSHIGEEIAGFVEGRWAIVEESGGFVEEMDLKNNEISGSVGGNGRPLKKSGVPLKGIQAPLKENLSAFKKWKAP